MPNDPGIAAPARDRTTPVASGEVTYAHEEQDLIAAFHLHYWAKTWNWRTPLAGGVALMVLAAVVIAAGEGWPVLVGVLVGGTVGGVAVPFAMLRWRVPAVARRIYRQQRHLHDEHTVAWDGEGLRVRTPNMDSRTPWTHYRRWRDDARVVLLYQSDTLFQFVPKRVLSQEQVRSLRVYAAAGGVPGA